MRFMEARDGMGASGEYHGFTEVPGFELDHEAAEARGAFVLPVVQSYSEGKPVYSPVLYHPDNLGELGALIAPDGTRQVFVYANQDISGMHVYHLVREEVVLSKAE